MSHDLITTYLLSPIGLFAALCLALVVTVVLMIKDLTGDKLKYSKPLNAYQRAKRKARTGDPKACLQAADYLEKGLGGAHHNLDKSYRYLRQAAGIYYHRASQGDGHAALKLAEIYNRHGGYPHLTHMADRAYRSALMLNEANAARGDVNGLAFSGYQYRYGLGCVSDYDKAAAYLQKAADMGHAPSMRSLAELYLLGFKSKPDPISAAKLVKQAALTGEAEAIERVGDNYLDAMGEPASRETAYYWYCLAAQKGRRDAMRKLEKLEKAWTPKQLRDVQERMGAWVPA